MYVRPIKYAPPPESTRPPEIWGARFPSEIFEKIMDHLPDCIEKGQLPKTLYICCLTCRDWLPRSLHLLYSNVALSDRMRFQQFSRTVKDRSNNYGSFVRSLMIDCPLPLKEEPVNIYSSNPPPTLPPIDEKMFIHQNVEAEYRHLRVKETYLPFHERTLDRAERVKPTAASLEQSWVHSVPINLARVLCSLAALELRSFDLTRVNGKFYQSFSLFKNLEVLRLINLTSSNSKQLLQLATAIRNAKVELHLACNFSPPLRPTTNVVLRKWAPLPRLRLHLPAHIMAGALQLAIPQVAEALTSLFISMPEHKDSEKEDLVKSMEALKIIMDIAGSSLLDLSLVMNWIPPQVLKDFLSLKSHNELRYLSLSVLANAESNCIVDTNITAEFLQSIASTEIHTLRLFFHAPKLWENGFPSEVVWESLDNELTSQKYSQLRDVLVEVYHPTAVEPVRMAERSLRMFLPKFSAWTGGSVWPEKSICPGYYKNYDASSKSYYGSELKVAPKRGRAPPKVRSNYRYNDVTPRKGSSSTLELFHS